MIPMMHAGIKSVAVKAPGLWMTNNGGMRAFVGGLMGHMPFGLVVVLIYNLFQISSLLYSSLESRHSLINFRECLPKLGRMGIPYNGGKQSNLSNYFRSNWVLR